MKKLFAFLSVALILAFSAVPVFAASDEDNPSPTATTVTVPETTKPGVSRNESPTSPKTGDATPIVVSTVLVAVGALSAVGVKLATSKK